MKRENMDDVHGIASPPRRRFAAAALFALALAGCASTPVPSVPPEARAALAPTGTLRIAVYPGSPTSLVQPAAPEQMRGVSVDLGRALAQRLGVPAAIQVYPRQQEVLAAVQRGDADFTITNATAERMRVVDFAQPLVDLEQGLLVPPGSRVTAIDAVDQAGVTVGVSQGSTSERVLAPRLKQAKLRTFPSLDAAAAALRAREVDGYATNKGILFELADRVPGTRVLDGRFGTEHLAPAIPQGRPAGLAYLQVFTGEVRRSGELERATQRAGLRGTVAPQP
jgi:polar amino acid transport system substrate-binding protein